MAVVYQHLQPTPLKKLWQTSIGNDDCHDFGYDVLFWPFQFSKWAKFPLLGSNRCVVSRNPQFGRNTLLIHYLDNEYTFIQLLLDANTNKSVMRDSEWILQLIHQGSELFSSEQNGSRAHVLSNQLIRGSFLKTTDVHKGIYADVVHKSLVD